MQKIKKCVKILSIYIFDNGKNKRIPVNKIIELKDFNKYCTMKEKNIRKRYILILQICMYKGK